MENHLKTVASVTVYYKNEYLAGLVFEDTVTADKFVGKMQQLLSHRGTVDCSFRGEIKTVYGALDDTLALRESLIRMIDRRNRE